MVLQKEYRQHQNSTISIKIVENEKGLLNDFKIIQCRLDNEILPSSYNVQFGDIQPHET
jgi:hypothetical protein